MPFIRPLLAPILMALTFLAGLAVGDVRRDVRPEVKNLLLAPLDDRFTPGRDVLVDVVTIPPNSALERHWHPGEEFHYYMEGDAEIQLEGSPTIVGRPGTVGHVPFRTLHRAVAGKKGAKIVVFRVHTRGEPWRYADSLGVGRK